MNDGQVLPVFVCWGWALWFEHEEGGFIDVEVCEGECPFDCSQFALDVAVEFSQCRNLWCWSWCLGFEVGLHFGGCAGTSFWGGCAVASGRWSVTLGCWVG